MMAAAYEGKTVKQWLIQGDRMLSLIGGHYLIIRWYA